jgi:hypothetical protein
MSGSSTFCVPPAELTGTASSAASSVSSTAVGLFHAATQGNLVNTIAEDAKIATRRAQLIAEYTAICTSLMGIPSPGFILELQSILRFLRIEPSGTSIAIEAFLIPLVFIALITFILGLIWNYSKKHWQIALGVFFLLCILYYVFVLSKPETPPESFANAKVPISEGFQTIDPAPTSSQYTLLNIQPAAVKQIGYIGPNEYKGTFNPSTGILNALNSGVRFMILQIDFLESKKNSSNFDDVGVPTLLYRDNLGNITSENSESIADVATNLATYAFNSQVPMNTEPLVLYLHFVKTPNYVTNPGRYMNYLSAVASALEPIQPMVLKQFTRQENEVELLQTPITKFQNKIILLANVDTSFFRNSAQLGLPTVEPKQDLDAMIHLRVYLESEADPIGATMISPNPNAVIMSYDRLAAMSDPQKITFSEKGKSRFVIAMPKPLQKITQKHITKLLTSTGVNIIPVNLFGQTYQDVSSSLSAWGKTPFFMIKPVLLQSTGSVTTGYNEKYMSSP